VQNVKNFIERNFYLFKEKNVIFSALASKLQNKPPADQREHQAVKNMMFLIFFFSFWGWFCLPAWIQVSNQWI
jgi:hypothetical protein